MLKTILVPLDGTPLAETALPYATSLARRGGAQLALVRAVANPKTIDEAEQYLARTAASLAERGFTVDTGVPYGAPTTWIPAEVELRDADLVVMATHARANADRWLHGSVAEAVVSHARVPVMVVRAGSDQTPRFEQARPTLLVPLDGSEFAETALPLAQQLARVLEARLVLVGVASDPARAVVGEVPMFVYGDEDTREVQTETLGYLSSVAARLASGIPVETVVRIGDPATEIALEAEDRGAAAVVMATHGRTGVARTILGSVAGGVVHRGAGAVILVRPPAVRPSEVGAIAPRPAVAGSG